MSKHYTLICQVCRKEFTDNGYRLGCDENHEPGLLLTNYTLKQFEVQRDREDIYRYQQWLPIQRTLEGTRKAVVYQSKSLSRMTRLSSLWIAFSGYWPAKSAMGGTTTFKDLEAPTVLSRIPLTHKEVLVVASAGNTAAAFAFACSQCCLPCVIILPESGIERMQFRDSLHPCVKIVVLTGFVDYYDAIMLANRVASHAGFILEGGVHNVARRDGLGTILCSAVEMMGRLPDYYFQAIGSGAGGIAVHDTAKKLLCDGRFGQQYPRLMLSQNSPFTPIYHSWKAQQRSLIEVDQNDGKKQIRQIAAQVLSNQRPPYSVRGGVFDALQESQGDMLVATNHEVSHAMALFREAEGIDIDPAAGVAFATLLKQAAAGSIEPDAHVLLNITGGGWIQRSHDYQLVPAQPTLEIKEHELSLQHTVERIVQVAE